MQNRTQTYTTTALFPGTT